MLPIFSTSFLKLFQSIPEELLLLQYWKDIFKAPAQFIVS